MICCECNDGEYTVLLTARHHKSLKVCADCAARILAVARSGGAPYHITYVKPGLISTLVMALLSPKTMAHAISSALIADIHKVREEP